MDEPKPTNAYQKEHANLLIGSYEQVTGKSFSFNDLSKQEQAKALYEAPFCVLSHGTQEDPVFTYGNKTAQRLFEMNWSKLTSLPSRLSAEPQIQSERDRLLEQVTKKGFIDDYKGIRISATGKRFRFEDAVVWNILDNKEQIVGQAAVLFEWSALD